MKTVEKEREVKLTKSDKENVIYSIGVMMANATGSIK